MSGLSSVKGFVGKIVLHCIYQYSLYITAFLLLELIPCDDIPISDKPQYFFIASHFYKQAWACNIAATYEYAKRRQFLKDMRFPGSLWPEFHKIIIIFYMWKQTSQCDEFFSSIKFIGIKTNSVHHKIEPLFCGKLAALIYINFCIYI